ncbi:ATP-binding cassette domain-containing protein [uncultured Olsenella sp.]|uniref:ATP-binding cassette domain-containing protein n=1 Tax=uncultured Olsenella sp. TaxID=190764 RepID=UPI0026DBAB02|nr:ATP-binding cassette domain-containing protein [uncultured Olsenella sp.]
MRGSLVVTDPGTGVASGDACSGCAVEVSGLSKRLRGVSVLDDVSLCADAGETIGLSGQNGSGKTMLMRAIAGLIRPNAGRVTIDGKELWKDIPFPPSVGLLLEGPAFLADRSGRDNLRLLASIKGLANEDDCLAALRDVGLDPDDRRPYRKYSLGMKQRLGIAGALFERPSLLLLDEPTNALDADGVEMLKRLVRREQRRGATIVLACHAADILRELSHEVYHIAEGRIDGHEELRQP